MGTGACSQEPVANQQRQRYWRLKRAGLFGVAAGCRDGSFRRWIKNGQR
ncbi:hypothetical protein KCP78_04210 [Salmonella enterica subsp. enterica]|nr:hypothetical protein KCP78_04210 [Salmonella enterica subsp. enterica]